MVFIQSLKQVWCCDIRRRSLEIQLIAERSVFYNRDRRSLAGITLLAGVSFFPLRPCVTLIAFWSLLAGIALIASVAFFALRSGVTLWTGGPSGPGIPCSPWGPGHPLSSGIP